MFPVSVPVENLYQKTEQNNRYVKGKRDGEKRDGTVQMGMDISGYEHRAGAACDGQKPLSLICRDFSFSQEIGGRLGPHRVAAEKPCHQGIASAVRQVKQPEKRGKGTGDERHASPGHEQAGTKHKGK